MPIAPVIPVTVVVVTATMVVGTRGSREQDCTAGNGGKKLMS
jgi:hypothetical protein